MAYANFTKSEGKQKYDNYLKEGYRSSEALHKIEAEDKEITKTKKEKALEEKKEKKEKDCKYGVTKLGKCRKKPISGSSYAGTTSGSSVSIRRTGSMKLSNFYKVLLLTGISIGVAFAIDYFKICNFGDDYVLLGFTIFVATLIAFTL